VRGHAWIPCPICKKRFGGHERTDGNELWITERDAVAVCPRCGDEAARLNAENGYPFVTPPGTTTASGKAPTNSP